MKCDKSKSLYVRVRVNYVSITRHEAGSNCGGASVADYLIDFADRGGSSDRAMNDGLIRRESDIERTEGEGEHELVSDGARTLIRLRA